MTGLEVSPLPTDKQEHVFFPVATTVRNCTIQKPLHFSHSSYDNKEKDEREKGKGWNGQRFSLKEWLEAKNAHVKRQMISTNSGC